MDPMNNTPGLDPAFQKAADQATQALSVMLKMCHKQSPDSPACDYLNSMIKAIAEVEQVYESGDVAPTGGPSDAIPQDPMAGMLPDNPQEEASEGPAVEAQEGPNDDEYAAAAAEAADAYSKRRKAV